MIMKQLELFSDNIYDNRIRHLQQSLSSSCRLFDCKFNIYITIYEYASIFNVLCNDVLNAYNLIMLENKIKL